jgi:alkyl hydroperoxide reductase subunit AhpC
MVALVQRPAPDFKATSVEEGQFKDVKLADYLGQWYAHRPRVPFLHNLS